MVAAGVGISLLPTFSVVPDVFSKTEEISYLPLAGDFPQPRLTSHSPSRGRHPLCNASPSPRPGRCAAGGP
jgi:DNA-binding transcriptional LysR family regulator